MTTDPQATPDQPATSASELRRRWLDEARETGIGDTWTSKRRQPRYTWQGKLDVRVTSKGGAGEEYIATGRDISTTGIQFFCRQPITPSLNAELRPPGESVGVPVVIRHCTQTLHGYLIGADFLD
jgi:hypothetical protein